MGRKAALAGWLRGLDAQDIRDLLALRGDAADSRPHSLRALADELATAASLRSAVDGLDQACRDVLDTALRMGDETCADALAERLRCNGKASRAELKRTLGELRSRALLWSAGGKLVSSPGLRLLEDEPPRRITPAPRTPRRAAQHRGFADRAAIAPATSTVDGVTRLVELCDVEQVACRTGVGLRELRRIAGVLRTEEVRARLWVELALETRLLAVDDGRLAPTVGSDAWRDESPAGRLSTLADAWPRMAWTPGKQRAATAEPSSTEFGDRTRRGVLEWYARLGEDEAYEHRHEVVAELVWTRPAVHGRAATEAALVEAESLGLVALGASTALGRAVLAGATAEVADRFVPPAATTAHLRPDLTAVVAGLPSRGLSGVLDQAADCATGGWRFSGASVRRALDAGHEPDALLARLASVAEHGVPPTLEHLVREVARQHGRITVTPVACCVRTEDPVLLREIAGHRLLAQLSLQHLGPTVLASSLPVAETLALLRAAGYAPTTSTPDGIAVVERVARRRVEPPPPRVTEDAWRMPLTGQELTKLAMALVERERPRPRFVVHAADPQRIGTVRLLRDQSLVLRDSEVVLLAEALASRTSVEIAVANGPRSTVKHVITPVDHAAGNLKANCAPRGEHREFLVSRIRSVRAVTGV
ncbi:helicase-associated domain-containing protein [Saccharothrix sp. NRRL B-16314]|uniref:helicase-associated domain-containing protein n=1 Tax=Saccharothrix sp. NRRL B-16314 TaxID=1463825 RepID=UPI0006900AFA|nr:helicase-associated domain-containing protein [Saccharothrix sp. NRRL B-16314]